MDSLEHSVLPTYGLRTILRIASLESEAPEPLRRIRCVLQKLRARHLVNAIDGMKIGRAAGRRKPAGFAVVLSGAPASSVSHV